MTTSHSASIKPRDMVKMFSGMSGLGVMVINTASDIVFTNETMARWADFDINKLPLPIQALKGSFSNKCPIENLLSSTPNNRVEYIEYRLNRSGLSGEVDCSALVLPIVQENTSLFVLTWFKESAANSILTDSNSAMILSLLNQAPIGIMSLDHEWNCVFANQEASLLTNLSLEELSGRGWSSIFDHDEAQLQSLIVDLLASKNVCIEVEVRTSSAGRRMLEVDIRGELDSQGGLQHAVAAFIDVTDRVNRQQEIHKLANFDSTTGLYNRLALKHQLERYISIAKRLHQKVQVMFIDLDGFKAINDLYGHAVGDKVLVQVAQRLNRQVRSNDVVARFGGDEFVIVLPGEIPEKVVNSLAERINIALRQTYLVETTPLHLSASIGIATFIGSQYSENSETEDLRSELLKQADMAMYSAKNNGKNTYNRYKGEAGSGMELEFSIAQMLPDAIANQHIITQFQPIVNVNSQIIGVEALLRWHHERLGWINPETIISVAEANGYMVELQHFLLERNIRDFERLLLGLPKRYQNLRLSLNISSIEIMNFDHCQYIANRVSESRISPGQVMLELTESTLIEDRNEVVDNLEYLVESGFTIGLDDFGTGYSSLSYLTKFPIDVIKLDKSLIYQLSHKLGQSALVEGCILLSHSLGKKIVVEGVETESDFNALIKLNSDYIQGYYFSKALNLEDLSQWIIDQDALTLT